jgi:ankyrin repeat protein
VSKNHDSNTALHLAARYGYNEVVKIFLSHGVTIDSKNNDSNTALHLAAKNGHNEVVDLLLSHGVTNDSKNSDSNTALHVAARNGFKYIVSKLLFSGSSVNHNATVKLKNNDSDTALHLAVRHGFKYIVSKLLDSGAIVDEKSRDGKTLLAELSESGDTEISTLLLKYGANIEALDMKGQTPLMLATRAGNQSMVSLLLDNKASIEASDNDLLTSFHWSARDGHFAIFEMLLQKDANIEAETKHGDTALHLALEFNHSDIAASLILRNANINTQNRNGKSPIEVAISKGHIDMIYQLKDAGAIMEDNGEEALWLICLAAEAGQVSLIKSTLDKFDKEEKRNLMNVTLHVASRHGQVGVVTYLLDNGAEIESLNDDGLTPLFLAGQYPDVISTLIHRGACINARNQKHPHQGILHYFASLDQIEGVRLLLNCDYNIHIRDNDYRTALHYVARERNGNCEIADILLRQGIDINTKDCHGYTALHYCSEHESLDLANLLIGFGIDIDATARWSGSTALRLAIKCRNLKLISLLVRHRADVNARDVRETVLHTAVQKNLTAECALLIESGANVNSRDIQGDTPLAKALNNHKPSLVKLLLEHGASVDAFGRSETMTPNIISSLLGHREDYRLFRRCLDVVGLFVKAGADCSGMEETLAQIKKESPEMRKLLTEPSYQQFKLKDNMIPSSSIVHEREKDIPGTNDYYREDESETEDGDEARIPLKEWTSNNINVYEGKFSFFINMHRFAYSSILIIFIDCFQSGSM